MKENNSSLKLETPTSLRAKLLKKWARGYFFKEFVGDQTLFPFKISIKKPSSKNIDDDFENIQKWIKLFLSHENDKNYFVEWQDVNSNLIGRNSFPVAIIFESIMHLSNFVGRACEYESYSNAKSQLLTTFPKLSNWVESKPFSLIKTSSFLEKLICVTSYMYNHRSLNIYLRQISISGVDSKFIESNKKLLSQWLEILSNSCAESLVNIEVLDFEKRYGYLSKPILIRFRVLDKSLYINGLSDLTVRADEFAKLNLNIDRVFVVENDINALAFPMVKNSIVIFGRGYGFHSVSNAKWLLKKEIWYWGDLDTHGFAILNQFRTYFSHTKSFLMDKQTLLNHKDQWGLEKNPSLVKLLSLTSVEQSLYEELKNNNLGTNIRLEQEHILWKFVKKVLAEIICNKYKKSKRQQ